MSVNPSRQAHSLVFSATNFSHPDIILRAPLTTSTIKTFIFIIIEANSAIW